MPVKVVDASALGALVFGEPKAEAIASELMGATLAAPPLLRFELASICLKKIKKHSTQAQEILAAFRLSKRLAIEIVEVVHPEVIQLARKTGLTTYDASYLWLAYQLNGQVVTLDKRLAEVSGQ
ncbi:MAG: type II toxin-antitoxin system VapC family toxin [Desulfobacterales bacterium]|jgi:predicted nucleic acid-binding protein|nr:type II toxin-antitoxin system VapC family toxin [Desulfobacterales bacterium]MCK5487164.1 type II toxin-antitoxin system VapC family toxin [Desulfobacterales bacterium]